MGEISRFEVVEEDEPAPQPAVAQRTPIGEKFAIDTLVLAVTALSKRAVVALSNLFTLLTVSSAFWLWYCIPDPNPNQIVSLSIYAVFVLVANYIVRRT